MVKSGDIVSPGEVLGEINKFKSGEGTYVDKKGGYIRSIYYGIVEINEETNTISVKPFKETSLIKVGDIVLGEITSVSDTIAMTKIYFSYHSKKMHPLQHPFSGTIHISQLGFRASKLYEFLKIGDLILARVLIDRDKPLALTIASQDLGVVSARCGLCGGEMIVKNYRAKILKCKSCGNEEKRKISRHYDPKIFEKYYKLHKPKRFEREAVEV